jgi:hypothetical protein
MFPMCSHSSYLIFFAHNSTIVPSHWGEGGGGVRPNEKPLLSQWHQSRSTGLGWGLVGQFVTSCSMRVCHSFFGFFFFFLGRWGLFFNSRKNKNEKATVNSTLGVVHTKAFFKKNLKKNICSW